MNSTTDTTPTFDFCLAPAWKRRLWWWLTGRRYDREAAYRIIDSVERHGEPGRWLDPEDAAAFSEEMPEMETR